jgi:hypothetical protein
MAERDIPHGHGLSHKLGISDGLLGRTDYEVDVHETHRASYRRGLQEGEALQQEIASRVRPDP